MPGFHSPPRQTVSDIHVRERVVWRLVWREAPSSDNCLLRALLGRHYWLGEEMEMEEEESEGGGGGEEEEEREEEEMEEMEQEEREMEEEEE